MSRLLLSIFKVVIIFKDKMCFLKTTDEWFWFLVLFSKPVSFDWKIEAINIYSYFLNVCELIVVIVLLNFDIVCVLNGTLYLTDYGFVFVSLVS